MFFEYSQEGICRSEQIIKQYIVKDGTVMCDIVVVQYTHRWMDGWMRDESQEEDMDANSSVSKPNAVVKGLKSHRSRSDAKLRTSVSGPTNFCLAFFLFLALLPLVSSIFSS